MSEQIWVVETWYQEPGYKRPISRVHGPFKSEADADEWRFACRGLPFNKDGRLRISVHKLLDHTDPEAFDHIFQRWGN